MGDSACRAKSADIQPADSGNSIMKEILTPVREMLSRGRTVAVATILSHAGSTPRTSGAKMMVRQDGSIEGTIGGGLVEAQVIQEAVRMIPVRKNVIREFTLDQTLKNSLDMVCGGSLTVLIEIVDPGQSGFYERIAEEAATGKPCARLLDMQPVGEDAYAIRQGLILSSHEIIGDVRLPESPGVDLFGPAGKPICPTVVVFGDRRFIMEPVLAAKTLYIFGAGHVSLCLARVMSMMDFAVAVVDDREEFANTDRFPMADQVHVTGDLPGFFNGASMDQDSCIVIVTRGHLNDQEVLAEALKTDAGYIGMIGSKRKRNQIYGNLMAQGVSSADLERVHSPIGLEIHAETPAEIAVSIAAELIQVKNTGISG